jgi:hypothetical protein
VFGGNEAYDRPEGDGPVGGTPWDSPGEPESAQTPETPEDSPPAETVAIPPPEPTGDERVDAVLARFDDLAGAPVAGHVEIFEDVQRGLQDVLASVDQEETGREETGHEEGDAPQARSGQPGGRP